MCLHVERPFKQTNKQTNKQTTQQTTNKQTNIKTNTLMTYYNSSAHVIHVRGF